jgi:hypothetical protein
MASSFIGQAVCLVDFEMRIEKNPRHNAQTRPNEKPTSAELPSI